MTPDAPLTADGLVEIGARAAMDGATDRGGRWEDAPEAERDLFRGDFRRGLAAVAQAGLMRDPDSGQFVAIQSLEMAARQLRGLGAEDMAAGCDRAASLLRALAEVSR